MNNLRQLSISCTVKKIAFRQSKDGVVISFLLNPCELPEKLAFADLGTPYMMALVEIDDNDQPISQGAAQSPAPGPEPLTARAAAVDLETRAVKRAGYLCKDKRFQTFLKEEFPGGLKLFRKPGGDDAEDATVAFVRWRCGVQSRSEIKTNPDAYARWQELDGLYQAWLEQ
jgi:hypothetical protein